MLITAEKSLISIYHVVKHECVLTSLPVLQRFCSAFSNLTNFERSHAWLCIMHVWYFPHLMQHSDFQNYTLKINAIIWHCKKIPITRDDVIKWKNFPRYWSFVRGIHWSPLNSPHKGQWCRALMFSLISAWISAWVNNCEPGDLRRHCAHYDVIVMRISVKIAHDYTRSW